MGQSPAGTVPPQNGRAAEAALEIRVPSVSAAQAVGSRWSHRGAAGKFGHAPEGGFFLSKRSGARRQAPLRSPVREPIIPSRPRRKEAPRCHLPRSPPPHRGVSRLQTNYRQEAPLDLSPFSG